MKESLGYLVSTIGSEAEVPIVHIAHLGDGFWRFRFGIGHPGHKDAVADYVLHPARREEQEAIDPAFDRSLGLLARIATGRMTDATTWLHTLPKPEIEIPVESGKPAPKKDTQ